MKRSSVRQRQGRGGRKLAGAGQARTPARPQMQMGYCEVGTRPWNDSGYFEQMTRTVFNAGFSWRTIEAKWPNFRRAFSDFSPERVARYDEAKVRSLLGDEGIVRNRTKILATIKNAGQFVAIRKEQGSFNTYMEELRRLPEEARCRILSKEFSHLGPSSTVTFLRAVGEEMPEMSRRWMAPHQAETGD